MKRKNIIGTVVFFLIVFVTLILLSNVCNRIYLKSNNVMTGRFQNIAGIQSQRNDTVDVLVLGDSESYTSVSPSYLWQTDGISAYAIGESGQTVIEAYYAMKTALETQKPKVVFIETNMLYRGAPKLNTKGAAFSEFYQSKFSIFRYHNMWKNYFTSKHVKHLQFFNGFSIRSTVTPYTQGPYMNKTEFSKPIPDDVKKYFNNIISLCKKKDVQVVLYSAPSPKNYNYEKHNAISEYAVELGVPYLDLNLTGPELQINWNTETLDQGDHLNVAGAQKTSEYIRSYLKTNYVLQDHRSDVRYNAWAKRAAEFQKQCDAHTKKIEDGGT